MTTMVLSDRVRIDPQSGAVLPRDLPATEATRGLESDFAARRVLRAEVQR